MIDIGLDNVQENLMYKGILMNERIKFGIQTDVIPFQKAHVLYNRLLENYTDKYLVDFAFSASYPLAVNTDFYAVIEGVNLYIGNITATVVGASENKALYLALLENFFIFDEDSYLIANTKNIHFYKNNNLGSVTFSYSLVERQQEFNIDRTEAEYKKIIGLLINNLK